MGELFFFSVGAGFRGCFLRNFVADFGRVMQQDILSVPALRRNGEANEDPLGQNWRPSGAQDLTECS